MTAPELIAAREKLGLTPVQMADVLQVSLCAYERWEAGAAIPLHVEGLIIWWLEGAWQKVQ